MPGIPNADGECPLPWQAPTCQETIAHSLGWRFDLLQSFWVLLWCPLAVLLLFKTYQRGLMPSSTLSWFCCALAVSEALRSIDPYGYRGIMPQHTSFNFSFAGGVLLCMGLFELNFMFVSILNFTPSANKSTALLSLPMRLVAVMPLTPRQQILRIVLHVWMLTLFLAFIGCKLIAQRALITLFWALTLFIFVVSLMVYILVIRARLQRSRAAETERVLHQSRRLLRLVLTAGVMLSIWFPIYIIFSLVPALKVEGHLYYSSRVTPSGLGARTVVTCISFVVCWVAYGFFLRTPETASSKPGTKQTSRAAATPRPEPSVEMARSIETTV